jgi:hypothetical protein
MTLRFLDHGYFVAPDRRNPLGHEGREEKGERRRGRDER